MCLTTSFTHKFFMYVPVAKQNVHVLVISTSAEAVEALSAK